MTDNTYQQSDYPTPGSYETQRTGWTGWIAFAGVMMIISGGLNALYGLVAVVNDEWVVWTNRTELLVDISQWGWVHLIVGLVMVFSGFGVFSGHVPGPHRRRHRRRGQPDRQLRVHPGLPAVGPRRRHHRRADHLGPHRPRQRDAQGLTRRHRVLHVSSRQRVATDVSALDPGGIRTGSVGSAITSSV